MKINQLANIIAQQHHIHVEEANVFLQKFVETIQEALNKDGMAKIEGLGTFKIAEVKPRESINVNTGERQLIPAYKKVTFTPVAKLKDLINKPFEQFQTVILKDGVKLPDTEELIAEDINDNDVIDDNIQEETPSADNSIATLENTTIQDKHSDQVKPLEENISIQEDSVSQEEMLVESNESAQQEDNTTSKDAPADNIVEDSYEETESTEKQQNKEDVIEQHQQTSLETNIDNNITPLSSQTEEQSEYSFEKKNASHPFKNKILFILLSLIAVCILAVLLMKNSNKEKKENPIEENTPKTETKQELSQDEINKQNLLKKANEQLQNLPYDIVDIYDTIPARQGMSPRSLAPTYGGAGTEIYIKVLNDNKQTFEERENIYIPILELKK